MAVGKLSVMKLRRRKLRGPSEGRKIANKQELSTTGLTRRRFDESATLSRALHRCLIESHLPATFRFESSPTAT